MNKQTLIVFSHLRWEFVKQRPQHIIERLSKQYRILFFEEPIGENHRAGKLAKELSISKNLTVIQPYGTFINPHMYNLLVAQYTNNQKSRSIIWFYSAIFVDVLEYISHDVVVYDCMDELTAFLGAPPELIEKENKLLQYADIVFTGGHSLYKAKKQRHNNVYSFPSSVERKHFEQAYKDKTVVPKDLASIPKPIVGFYGVLDERMDLDLIAHTAKTLSDVSFVFIGPIVKVNPELFPKAKNIHYLGQKSYDVLPNYLKGFTVACMPFAINKATQYISPTKTLEFMAGLKPIVSTPIHDVVHDFSREVKVADTKEQFVKAIQFYKDESLLHKMQRQLLQQSTVLRYSWDRTVEEMYRILQQTLEQKALESSEVEEVNRLPSHSLSYI